MGSSQSTNSNLPHPALVSASGAEAQATPIVFTVTVLDAKLLPEESIGHCDPKAVVSLQAPGYAEQRAETKTRSNNCPIWKQGFTFSVDPSCADASTVTVDVLTNAGAKNVGKVTVPFKSILYREFMDEKFKLPPHHDGTTPVIRLVFEVVNFAGATRRASADVHRRPSAAAPCTQAEIVK